MLNYIPDCYEWIELVKPVDFQYLLDNRVTQFHCVSEVFNQDEVIHHEDFIYYLDNFLVILSERFVYEDIVNILNSKSFVPVGYEILTEEKEDEEEVE